MHITFIRHTSVQVAKNRCYGQTDVALAETFPAEMQRIRAAIDPQGHDGVFSSPLSRCQRLANALVSSAPIQLDERLMELNFGDWEMAEWDAIFATPAGKLWFDNYADARCPNGEAFSDQLARMASFLASVRALGHRHALAFTHAGCIRAALCLIGNKSAAEAFATPLDYGQILTFSLDNDEPAHSDSRL